MTRPLFALSCAALLTFSAGLAEADHASMPLDQRIKQSRLIAIAKVIKVEEVKEEGRRVYKIATLAIETPLRDAMVVAGARKATPKTVAMRFGTGYACDGQDFEPGERALVFLCAINDTLHRRVNWQQGAIKLKDGKVRYVADLDPRAKAMTEAAALKLVKARIAKLFPIKEIEGTVAGGASCTKCGKTDKLVKVYYGRGSMSQAAKHGGHAAGCSIDETSPSHWCKRCEQGVGNILKEREAKTAAREANFRKAHWN